jgi:alpha-beta hydrolase superfamily lysophospholipase
MPPPLPEILVRSDPVHRGAQMAGAGRAVLLLNGGADVLVPAQCNEALFADLQRRLGEERARMVVYPGVKHEVTEEMLQSALAWLAKFMPPALEPRL